MKMEQSLLVGALAAYLSIIMLMHACRSTHAQNLQQLSYANAEVAQVLIRPHIVVTTEPPPVPTTEKTGFLNGIRSFFSRNSASTNSPAPKEPATTTAPPPARPTLPSVASNANANAASNGIRLYSGPPNNRNQQQVNAANQPTPSPRLITPPTAAPRSQQPTAGPTQPTAAPRAKRPEEDFPALGAPRSRPGGVINPAADPVTSTPSSVWGIPGSPLHQNSPIIPRINAPTPSPSANAAATTKQPEIATQTEIEEITETLFTKATPNIMPFIMVNLQGRTRSSSHTDDAPLPLLTVNETVLTATPTIIKLRQLFDNYEIDTSVNEYVSPLERQEEADFLDAVLATPVMKAAMRFLQTKGIVTADPKTHFDMLRTIWFENYSRGMGKVGSSAFEHVFLGETKNHSMVSGLHNWIWFYYKEGQSGQSHPINYMGYMNNVMLGNKGQILKYRFSYDNLTKPVNAMFIGTLPELDMAVYTICFQVTPNRGCPVSLAGNKFTIRTHTFKYRGKRLIGSAFPEI